MEERAAQDAFDGRPSSTATIWPRWSRAQPRQPELRMKKRTEPMCQTVRQRRAACGVVDSMPRARSSRTTTTARRGDALQQWLPRRRSTTAICNYGLQGWRESLLAPPEGHLGNRRRRRRGTLSSRVRRAGLLTRQPSPALTHSARSHIHSSGITACAQCWCWCIDVL